MHRNPLTQILIAVVVLLAGGLALRGQETVGMSDASADKYADLCTNQGGDVHYEFNADGSVRSISCTGGSGGSWIFPPIGPVNAEITDDGWSVIGTDGTLHEVIINVEDVTFATELPADAATPLTPAVADEPMLVEAVVTWNPSAEAAAEAGLVQVNTCRMLGGTEVVIHTDGNPESTSFTVQCDGGILNGMWCAFGVGLSTCFVLPGSIPEGKTDDMSTVPVGTTIAEYSEPTAESTTAPTAPPPTATVIPTDEPVIEPTAPPVEPTLPMFEPFDPTPTPVILT